MIFKKHKRHFWNVARGRSKVSSTNLSCDPYLTKTLVKIFQYGLIFQNPDKYILYLVFMHKKQTLPLQTFSLTEPSSGRPCKRKENIIILLEKREKKDLCSPRQIYRILLCRTRSLHKESVQMQLFLEHAYMLVRAPFLRKFQGSHLV